MTCCAGLNAGAVAETIEPASLSSASEELRLASSTPREGVSLLRLSAPDLRCGACVASVERALNRLDGVLSAKANLTAKTVTVEWRTNARSAQSVADAVEAAGFRVFPLDDVGADDADRRANNDLLLRMAVAGFAAANVMLLSVSVWAGADGATRDLMHWISAAIALPTVAYSGRPFFVSALTGLRAGRLNMDAPISLAILLAAIVSLYEVTQSGTHAYFDAAVTLIFLLLVGRYLDGAMRAGARSTARRLARLAPRGAWILSIDGQRDYRPLEAIKIGDRLVAAPGDRFAVDGVVETGRGSIDRALLTGESTPVTVEPGARVEAGALNLDGALTVRATATAANSTLAEIASLVAAAEERKSRLARLADQAARIYAPLVHGVALVVLVYWLAMGLPVRDAILIAVALLIVTCPCALGLAAPMAQAVASGALFRRGVMLKDGAALERLALIRAAAFDKTGVLTLGEPVVTDAPDLSPSERAIALRLAEASRHPAARAVADWVRAQGAGDATLVDMRETAGGGVSGNLEVGDAPVSARLGSALFCDVERDDAADGASHVWLRIGDAPPKRFEMTDALRPGGADVVAAFTRAGVRTEMLTGDRAGAAEPVARRLGLDWRAGLSPQDKIAAVDAMRVETGQVLMVGDGLNDAPALASADVSMAPASASDVGRASADMVFTGRPLTSVTTAWRVATKTRAVILQNFALAACYNMIAIPLAASGWVGPLEAAIAMSTSSLLVTANALRIARTSDETRSATAPVLPQRDAPPSKEVLA